MSYKVWILAVGENSWATNGLKFKSVELAQEYGRDLLSRWYGADRFAVLPLTDNFTGHLSHETVNKYRED